MGHAIATLVESSETDLEEGSANDDPDLWAQASLTNTFDDDPVASLPLEGYRVYNERPSLSPPVVCSIGLQIASVSLTENEDIS